MNTISFIKLILMEKLKSNIVALIWRILGLIAFKS